MCVNVQWVTRNSSGNVTHIGGADPRTHASWGLTTAEAVAQLRSKMWEFVVDVGGSASRVHAVLRGTGDYLTTSPDGTTANNLDLLPSNPQPLSGVFPQLPQSLPGGRTLELLQITGISYVENRQRHQVRIDGVTPGPATTLQNTVDIGQPPASFWGLDPRPIRIEALVPFPSTITVACGPTVLRQVYSDEILTQENLQDAGQGWWTVDYVLTGPDGLPDPSLPARLTPVRITVLPLRQDWQQENVWLGVYCHTLNPACYALPVTSDRYVSFTLRKPPDIPKLPPRPKVTVPGVVGLREDQALNALWAVPLQVQVIGPVDVATNLVVESQSPVAGASVNPHSTVYLTVQTITPPTGTKSVVVENVSNVQRTLDIWRLDQTTGAWAKAATVGYGAAEDVDLPDDGHLYTLSAFFEGEEPPDDRAYSMRTDVVLADGDGSVGLWQIL